MSINIATIAGNLTRDPELRTTAGGASVLSFSVAVSERVKRGDEWEDRPSYFDVTMFGKRAESLSRYLGKGTKVSVQGRLRQERWEKDGKTNSRVTIIADEVEFMSKAEPKAEHQSSVYDDDIPF